MIIALTSLLLVSGCAKKKEKDGVTDAQLSIYETYYNTIYDNAVFSPDSSHFSLETEMTALPDGTYRYYVVIDHPKVAMYNVTALVIEDHTAYDEADKMMPSIGIFDDSVSLIPYQVNTEEGFAKCISLSGESSEKTISLQILVEWRDSTGTKRSREFIAKDLEAEEKEN